MAITCGIQPTSVVTMVVKVLHNTCNVCICELPDMNALVPLASGIHTYQANPSCPWYNYYMYVRSSRAEDICIMNAHVIYNCYVTLSLP